MPLLQKMSPDYISDEQGFPTSTYTQKGPYLYYVFIYAAHTFSQIWGKLMILYVVINQLLKYRGKFSS